MNALLPEIKSIKEKKLVGKRMTMTFAKDRTSELWQSFIPHQKEIFNKVSSDFISLQVYPNSFDFNSNKAFEKWAAVEVFDFSDVPDSMEKLVLKSGLYAVFHYKGLSTDNSVFRYIFAEWLPKSSYNLDNRPHFEILGYKYRNNDPESEEEIWIPVRPKKATEKVNPATNSTR